MGNKPVLIPGLTLFTMCGKMQFPNAVYIPKVSHSGRSKEGAKGPFPPPPQRRTENGRTGQATPPLLRVAPFD